MRLLHDACLKLGGEHKLAVFLGVPASDVDSWLNGHSVPPDWVFLRCTDLLAEPG